MLRMMVKQEWVKKLEKVKKLGRVKKKLKFQGDGIATDVGGVATDMFIHHGIPWMVKKNC